MSRRVGYLVGNIEGRDHQPWPTILLDELVARMVEVGVEGDEDAVLRNIDLNYPIAMDLETMMQFSWRVREWKLNSGGFGYGGGGWSLAGSLPDFTLLQEGATDERRILWERQEDFGNQGPNPYQTCSGYNSVVSIGGAELRAMLSGSQDQGSGPEPITDPYTGPDAAVAFNMSLFSPGYVIFDPDTGLFWPRIKMEGHFTLMQDFGIFSQGNAVKLSTMADPVRASGSDYVVSGGLTITNPTTGGDDIVVPIGLTDVIQGPSGGFDHGAGSASWTMTPMAWWPYKNKAGDPVYNEETGEIINDPFG